jgi:alpha-L-arabinofuranosidase
LRGVAAKSATAQILHNADRNAANTFDTPDTVTPQPHGAQIDAGRLVVDLPPLSVVTVTVETA